MSAIIGQVLPFLSQEHQQQVATAVERAKQVTMSDLNSVVGVSICIFIKFILLNERQLQSNTNLDILLDNKYYYNTLLDVCCLKIDLQ